MTADAILPGSIPALVLSQFGVLIFIEPKPFEESNSGCSRLILKQIPLIYYGDIKLDFSTSPNTPCRIGFKLCELYSP